MSQDQYIITVRLTFEILNFLQKKKCIYISKNQFILGDVLTLSSPFCKYSKNEAAAAKRILNLPTVFELLLQWVILQTKTWADSCINLPIVGSSHARSLR